MTDIVVKQKPLFSCSEVLQILGPAPVKYFRLEKGKKIEIAPVELGNYKMIGENSDEEWYSLIV